MPTHWNTVGKVKNTIPLRSTFSFTTLYSAISLKVTRKCSHALLFSCTFTHETTATHVQLSRASSNHVVERWASSVYHYSQSFSTVKRKQITVPRVELTTITWHCAVCNCFHGYGRRAWHFADPGLNYAERGHIHVSCRAQNNYVATIINKFSMEILILGSCTRCSKYLTRSKTLDKLLYMHRECMPWGQVLVASFPVNDVNVYYGRQRGMGLNELLAFVCSVGVLMWESLALIILGWRTVVHVGEDGERSRLGGVAGSFASATAK